MSLEFGFRRGGTRFQKTICTLQREIQAVFPLFFGLLSWKGQNVMQCCARGAEARSQFRGEEELLRWGRLRRLGRLASLDSFSNRGARMATRRAKMRRQMSSKKKQMWPKDAEEYDKAGRLEAYLSFGRTMRQAGCRGERKRSLKQNRGVDCGGAFSRFRRRRRSVLLCVIRLRDPGFPDIVRCRACRRAAKKRAGVGLKTDIGQVQARVFTGGPVSRV